jgi:hypothetical protein
MRLGGSGTAFEDMQRLAVHELIGCRVHQEAKMPEKIHSYNRKLNCRQQKGPVKKLITKREAKTSFSQQGIG